MGEDQEDLAVVKKKRKAWWIACGLVGAVALFLAVTFVVDYYKADSRIEHAVEFIAEKYDFQFERESFGGSGSQGHVYYTYSRKSVDAETSEEIVAIIREACPSWKLKHSVFDLGREAYSFTPPKRHTGSLTQVLFNPDDKGRGVPDREPESLLSIAKDNRPSLWERIKGMWPW